MEQYQISTYPKLLDADLAILTWHINNSAITKILNYINRDIDTVDIYFNEELTSDDKTILTNIITVNDFIKEDLVIYNKNISQLYSTNNYLKFYNIVYPSQTLKEINKIKIKVYGTAKYSLRIYNSDERKILYENEFTNTEMETKIIDSLNLPINESNIEFHIKCVDTAYVLNIGFY